MFALYAQLVDIEFTKNDSSPKNSQSMTFFEYATRSSTTELKKYLTTLSYDYTEIPIQNHIILANLLLLTVFDERYRSVKVD